MNKLNYVMWEELRKQNICFTYQNPSEKGHKFNGKAQNIYLEVLDIK